MTLIVEKNNEYNQKDCEDYEHEQGQSCKSPEFVHTEKL